MKCLIIGIGGSMGSRRCRNLQSLGYNDIYGYDINNKKQIETCKKYGVHSLEYENFWDEALNSYKFDAILVCVPPTKKLEFIKAGNACEIPVFCEADVTEYFGSYYSSATLRHHPAIQKIKELLNAGTFGNVYTFTYHMGQSIYDWHPGCDMKTYYAAQKESSACREMFCFELSWLSYLFGTPVDVRGLIDKKLNDLDITADDVYSAAVKFSQNIFETDRTGCINDTDFITGHLKTYSVTGTMLIDIVSRPAIRELRIAGEKGTLKWNWNDSFISIDTADELKVTHGYDKGKAAEGYNANICEEMYQNELANFIDAIQSKAQYLFGKENEKAVMSMLRKVEKQ
jgi:predicted dehydrogenase